MAIGTVLDNETLTKEEEELKEPDQYRVILLNDDYTAMEFVVAVIIAVFHKPRPDATAIMLDVHRKGRGVVGIYPYDIAATKVKQVHELAKANDYPLKCTIEQA